MALKTNTKKVKETIKNYIIDGFHDSDYESWNNCKIEDYNEICSIILDTFYSEYLQHNYQYKKVSNYTLFESWAAGLPNIIDTAYYYNVCAVDLLGGWLEQTESEKAKYNERQAEQTITKLLWRELISNGKYNF